MRRVIKDGAREVVHRSIDNDERLVRIPLGVNHARKQNARRSNDGPAGFKKQSDTKRLDEVRNHARVGGARNGPFVGVTNAQAATEIKILQSNALLVQIKKIAGQKLQRLPERRQIDNLRADVGADSLPTNVFRGAL